MTKKGYKPKYQPQPEDNNKNGRLNRQMFVARIVNTENKPLTANEVHALINNKMVVNRGRTVVQTQANLADAVRTGRLDKTRIIIETRTDDDPKGYRGKHRVVYHPTNMKPMGLDIPVPSYTKDGGRLIQEGTLLEDDDDETKNDPTFPTGPWKNKPSAVKVAEKVIAHLGASDFDKREPVVQEVDIGTGWVKMENGVPISFTPNAWTSIADCINTTPEELTRMFVRHLSSRTIDSDHKVAGLCFQIKEMLLDGYGLSAHRRKVL